MALASSPNPIVTNFIQVLQKNLKKNIYKLVLRNRNIDGLTLHFRGYIDILVS